jgi:hypothetical protein
MRAFRFTAFMVLVACGGPNARPDAGADDAASDSSVCTATGVADCACDPVPTGGGGQLSPTRTIGKLVSDPVRCRIYGLAENAVLVFDTKAKTELAPIPLTSTSIDFDLSSDGARLVVAHRTARTVTVIDPEQLSITSELPVSVEPGRIEVATSGVAYYIDFDQVSRVRRLDLGTGAEQLLVDTQFAAYAADIELSADDTTLFAGDSASSSCSVRAYDVATNAAIVDRTRRSFEFSSSPRHLFSSRAGNLYHSAHQWRADNLDIVIGATDDENILAESDDGTLAIGTGHAWDVMLSASTTKHVAPVVAAAFAAAGQEAWTFDGTTLAYRASADLVGSHSLGVRELQPGPYSSYTLEQLVFDSTRNVLYARDSVHHAILVIDATTLQPTREIRVGPRPSDIALDTGGSALYVGYRDLQAITRIDLSAANGPRFDRFVQTPLRPYNIEAAGPGRLITADNSNSAPPTLFDVASGAAAPNSNAINFPTLAVSADGTTLVAAGSYPPGTFTSTNISRFTIGTSNLSLIAATSDNGFSASGPIVVHPQATKIFFSGTWVDGSDLSIRTAPTIQTIRAVSPDGRLAISATNVFSVATGANLGALPGDWPIMAVNSNSQTAYFVTPTGIATVDLNAF